MGVGAAGSTGADVGAVAGVVEAYRKAATETAAPEACDLHCEARSML